MVDIQYVAAEIRRGKKRKIDRRQKIETTGQKYNGPLLHRAAIIKLEMWANAQCDGRPAEYRWRPLFNAAVWLAPTTRVSYSNDATTRNPLKLPGVPQTTN